jgi:predicted nucleotidyltransferase
MAIELPTDFTEFLRSLTEHEVEFILIGGIAVALHGYPRATQDLDVWIARRRDNAERIVAALQSFGFDVPELEPELFLVPARIVRMGVPPLRIEILGEIDGVEFDDCMDRAVEFPVGGTSVPVIALSDLRRNKQAAGRPKDLDDLEHLPE